MTPSPDQPPAPGDKAERSLEDVMWGRVDRKRDRIRAEISRNRSGGHRVPTWVLVAILSLVVVGWVYLLVTS